MTLDRTRLKSLAEREQKRFVDERPKSKSIYERGKKSLLSGVPMNWMVKWAGAFPPVVREAQGAHFYDVDGHRYVDFCLGDTGAMTGHSPFATVKAIEEQVKRGITLMLPSEDAVFVAEELQQRFGLTYWQFALTATDANRFSIRLARQITGRPKILVFNWCYHGTVDETFITLHPDGTSGARRGNIGPPVDPSVTTRVVEFNDVAALEQALAHGDVACVLAEPALTNVGIVHPIPGYHQRAARTHAQVRNPAHHRRDPHHLRRPRRLHSRRTPRPRLPRLRQADRRRTPRRGLRLHPKSRGHDSRTPQPRRLRYRRNRRNPRRQRALPGRDARHAHKSSDQGSLRPHDPHGRALDRGRAESHQDFGLPWHVTRLGCRAEYLFSPYEPKNGTEAHDAMDFELERFLHLYAMNRGILLTPFHNMALMSPATAPEDVDYHSKVFRDAVRELAG